MGAHQSSNGGVVKAQMEDEAKVQGELKWRYSEAKGLSVAVRRGGGRNMVDCKELRCILIWKD